MALPQPTESPEWATSPSAGVIEPPAGKRAAGWAPGEAPPAQWTNWWKRSVGRWIAHLASRIDDIVVPDVSNFADLGVGGSKTATENKFANTQVLNREDAGTAWNLQLRLGAHFRVYTSSPDLEGAGVRSVGFAMGARYDYAAAEWQATHVGGAVFATVSAYGLTLQGQRGTNIGGPAAWVAWPTWSLGDAAAAGNVSVNRDVRVGGELLANEVDTQTLTAHGALTAQSVTSQTELAGDSLAVGTAAANSIAIAGTGSLSIVTQGGVRAYGGVRADQNLVGPGFRYPALVSTESELNLADGRAWYGLDEWFNWRSRQWLITVPQDPWPGSETALFLSVPIHLPVGARLYGIDMQHEAPLNVGPSTFYLLVRDTGWTALNPDGSGIGEGTEYASNPITPADGWWIATIESSLPPDGLLIAANRTYEIVWHPAGDPAGFARARVRWGDPGPQNRVS